MARKTTKKSATARLDKVARLLCFKLAKYQCERCGLAWNGEQWPATNLEWAHIERRGRKYIRWDMNNCLALCNANGNACHSWFDSSKTVASKWLEDTYPDKHAWLLEEVDGKPRSQVLFTDTVEDMLEREKQIKEQL